MIQPDGGAPIPAGGTLRRAARGEGLRPYLQLMRPANLPTAAADALAGLAIVGASDLQVLPFLCLASVALYAGGVTLNDAFDARLDAVERPERPIPSGRVAVRHAVLLGAALLAVGVLSAFGAGTVSGFVALALALLVLGYDAWSKHHPWLGPLNMGACRGVNLLLGMSAVPLLMGDRWHLALLPVAYVAAITAVSRGEVHGGGRMAGRLALGLLLTVIGGVTGALLARGATGLFALPFLLFFAWRVLPPFYRAAEAPLAEHARAAVKAGVLSVVALDAVLGASHAGPLAGALILSLMPVSGWLARRFAVT